MKKILVFPILLLFSLNLHGYKILYAEQFYRLYHLHLHLYPDDTLENIFYLERALRSDFANPLNALARITTKKEWEKYRYLFYMHVNLKLVESYLQLAAKYDKREAYFFNAPWQIANLESLKKSQQLYEVGLTYWKESLVWAKKASDLKFRWLYLEEIQKWEDERYRIEEGELDYREIIEEQLARLEKVRKKFLDMNENTY